MSVERQNHIHSEADDTIESRKMNPYLSEFHGMSPSERRTSVAEIRLGVNYDDMDYILDWSSDEETQGHLDPVPRIPDWSNQEDVESAREQLLNYYNNDGEPEKIQPMVAVNFYGEPIGVLTLRWRGDKVTPDNRRIASIERFIVNPRLQGKGVGKEMLNNALDYAFNKYKGYRNEQGAREVRAWVMTDRKAGNFSRNIRLFQGQGFSFVQGNTTWGQFKKHYGLEDDDREGVWLKVNKEDWLGKRNQTPPTDR